MSKFTHLHVHTQYSILDGASDIKKIISKTKELGMDSLAITDHGNMYGVLKFHQEAAKQGIKPILGCEMYVAHESRFNKDGRNFSGHHLILLAKNQTGYQNLIKLDSLAFAKEAFYRTSRIDKEILFKYHEGLICCSACLGGEIPSLLLTKGYEAAVQATKEYKDVFGDDYYLELQSHGHAEQEVVNEQLARISKECDIPLICTNDVHFVNEEDYDAHRILICLNTGRKLSEEASLFYTGQEYLKSPEQMETLFAKYPESVANTQMIADKVEIYPLLRAPILPVFDIPESFGSIVDYEQKYPQAEVSSEEITQRGSYEKFIRTKFESDYLRFLVEEGAKKHYGEELSDVLKERINFELTTIEWMGFPGYFLIVQDFINVARKELGVVVGPGRGSAAGSVVAYCLGITNIDPIKYNLLFERFLNPERISLPDVDIDFDDDGRARVIEYVQNKYGMDRVAQIVTMGSMAAKSAIRDVARVLELPLPESNRLAKLVPGDPKITLEKAFKMVPELNQARESGSELVKKTLRFAEQLEGSIRNVGVHACGVIIAPDEISNYVPLAAAKGTDMMVTQFEGSMIESVGMIKMDFLGLKTLSIIKDCCSYIQKREQKTINIDEIPIDDAKTFELYQRGDTIGTFQFESMGMRQHLQALKPDRMEDLIAMNALYRPGPMQYIPKYILRKHGKERVDYRFAQMEEFLSETYGITVYQEQVMLLSQTMAGFSKGEADSLRKAMGKKDAAVMAKMQTKFIEGCTKNGLDEKKVIETWKEWAEFANYAFNKSHSTCYALIAYQTAYLKAHYPGHYMASVLTHNLSDITKITFYIEECLRQQIKVMGPDINESDLNFMVNQKGEIRFGLAAIKGVGAAAAEEILREREQNGPFSSLFDLVERVNLRTVNRKGLESLAKAGALDQLCDHRAQLFARAGTNENDPIFLERLSKHGAKYQANKNNAQISLFGEESAVEERRDELPDVEPWSSIEQLRYEKEMIGFYISGHPLDSYKEELRFFTNTNLADLGGNLEEHKGKQVSIGCMVTDFTIKTTKKGTQFIEFIVEDFHSTFAITLFTENFMRYKHLIEVGNFLYIKGSVSPRWRKEDSQEVQYEFKTQEISLLSEVMEKLAKKIVFHIDQALIDEKLIQTLVRYSKAHRGKVKLSFLVYDTEKNLQISMHTSKIKVHPKEFITAISDIPSLSTFRVERFN